VETIIDYLQNPMKVGVYNSKIVINMNLFVDYLEKQLGKEKKLLEIKTENKQLRALEKIRNTRISRLTEALEELTQEPLEDEEFFQTLTKTLRVFAGTGELPEILTDIFYRKVTRKLPSGKTMERRLPIYRSETDIFGSRVLKEIKDVISVERKEISSNKWLFDITAIKEQGIANFKDMIVCIPRMKEQMQILKEKQKFSSRYTFRPYPLAVRLWLRNENSIIVTEDLRSFLQAASNYFFSEEWRTSIVLSAICVESVLADLYEEDFKETAPDVPLGEMFSRVKQKVNFPPDVAKTIEITNDARISAVHRSRFPVSDKEAVNALYGATNVVLWYTQNF